MQSPDELLESERAPRTLPRRRPGDSLLELECELADAVSVAAEVEAAVASRAAAERAARAADAWSPEPRLDEASHIGQLIDNRYVVEALIARGGMGIVYRCRHQLIDRKFAVKIIRSSMAHLPDAPRRFLMEAKAASSIGNEHIVDVVDYGMLADGSSYLVMELLDGLPLSDIIARHEALPLVRIAAIATQVCEGLRAAHEAGIVHRDLKPENIFLSSRKGADFVKVLDFGIAKMLGSDEQLTKRGLIVGTPHYMSPEQAAGAAVDARGDIYALGVILYELATGHVPFDATHYMAVLAKHMTQPPPAFASLSLPAQLPSDFEAIVQKCLAKRPEQRFQSMLELMHATERLTRRLNDAPEQALPPASPAGQSAASPASSAASPASSAASSGSSAAPLSRNVGSSVPAAPGRSVNVPARRTRGASLALSALAMLALMGISLSRMQGPEELHGAGAPTALDTPEADPSRAASPAPPAHEVAAERALQGGATPRVAAASAPKSADDVAVAPRPGRALGPVLAPPSLVGSPTRTSAPASELAEPFTVVELAPGKSVEIEARTRLSLRLSQRATDGATPSWTPRRRAATTRGGSARPSAGAKSERTPDARAESGLMNPWPTPAIGPARD